MFGERGCVKRKVCECVMWDYGVAGLSKPNALSLRNVGNVVGVKGGGGVVPWCREVVGGKCGGTGKGIGVMHFCFNSCKRFSI